MSQGNKRSFKSLKRGENLEPIPTDLVTEILSRLPAKSIGRFCCVSKLWGSMLHRQYFTELFLTRSRARPRILFAVETSKSDGWSLFSSPHPQNLYEKSLVVTADFHTKFRGDNIYTSSRGELLSRCYVSGLLYFSYISFSKEILSVICNPITEQYAILPKQTCYRKSYSFFMFDPIDKQFKVLSMRYPRSVGSDDHRILTIGTEKMMWRKIHCPSTHKPLSGESGGICINGVLYSLSRIYGEGYESNLVIVCFDVRSEEFKFIDAKCFRDQVITKLINYKGKLGGISLVYANVGGSQTYHLHMCLLEDVEKQEWSKHVYTLPNKIIDDCNLWVVGVAGMTATGEIVLSKYYHKDDEVLFCVFYFNPERNTFQSVEIQGFGESEKFGTVYAFVDHVEDLNANDAKLLKSSFYAQSVKINHEGDIPP